MKCKKIKKIMSKHFDNQVLSKEEKEMLFSHIDTCLRCKKEYNFFSQLFMFSPEYEKKQLSDNFNQRLISKIHLQEESRVSIFVPYWRKIFAPVFVMLLVILSLTTLISPCGDVKGPYYSYKIYPEEDIDLLSLETITILQNY